MKLPHWAQVALAFALVVVAWLMNEAAKGELVLPAAVVSGLTLLQTLLGLFSNAVGSTPAASRGNARGLSSIEATLAAVAIGAAILATGLWLSACSAAQQQSAKVDVAALGECIIAQVTSCAVATPPTPWEACTAQVAVACGTDVATVVSIWAAHSSAQARQADAGAKALSYPGP